LHARLDRVTAPVRRADELGQVGREGLVVAVAVVRGIAEQIVVADVPSEVLERRTEIRPASGGGPHVLGRDQRLDEGRRAQDSPVVEGGQVGRKFAARARRPQVAGEAAGPGLAAVDGHGVVEVAGLDRVIGGDGTAELDLPAALVSLLDVILFGGLCTPRGRLGRDRARTEELLHRVPEIDSAEREVLGVRDVGTVQQYRAFPHAGAGDGDILTRSLSSGRHVGRQSSDTGQVAVLDGQLLDLGVVVEVLADDRRFEWRCPGVDGDAFGHVLARAHDDAQRVGLAHGDTQRDLHRLLARGRDADGVRADGQECGEKLAALVRFERALALQDRGDQRHPGSGDRPAFAVDHAAEDPAGGLGLPESERRDQCQDDYQKQVSHGQLSPAVSAMERVVAARASRSAISASASRPTRRSNSARRIRAVFR